MCFIMVMKKKGVSDIVSTVLIILLVVAAIAVVGAIVVRTLNKAGPQVGSAASCLDLQVLPTRCSYSGTGNSPTVLINRKSGGSNLEISGLKFLFYKGVGSETRTSTIYLNALETKPYVFSGANALTAATASPDFVAVAATIKGSDGKDIQCSLSGKVGCTTVSSNLCVGGAPNGGAIQSGEECDTVVGYDCDSYTISNILDVTGESEEDHYLSGTVSCTSECRLNFGSCYTP